MCQRGAVAHLANLKRVLWHILGGTRGGPLRIRILAELRDRPSNTNQLATAFGVDYKTIQHHLRVLCENRLLDSRGPGYGTTYFLSPDMEQSLPEFDALCARLAFIPVKVSAQSVVPAPPQPAASVPSSKTESK